MNDTYRNPTAALYGLLEAITTEGKEVKVREQLTKEICGVHIRIQNPLERCFVIPHRNDNIFAKIAETLWVIAGRNDITWLSHYLPRAIQYSDDGKTWRGGYGSRLRRCYTYDRQAYSDPLEQVVKLLNDDPESRRAVISLWDNREDYVDSKDIPCNDWLHFIIRDGKLNMYVAQRSCDVLWGFSGINTFEWGTLMQMMAYWTGTEVGVLDYFISSAHLYELHWKRAKDILEYAKEPTIYDQGVQPACWFTTPFDQLDEQLKLVFDWELLMRGNAFDIITNFNPVDVNDNFLINCLGMLAIYNAYKLHYEPKKLYYMVESLAPNDFRFAAHEYLARNIHE